MSLEVIRLGIARLKRSESVYLLELFVGKETRGGVI